VFVHVEPGQTRRYHVTLPPNHPPGLFWYHAHSHGDSAGQVYGGLAGLIVVEGLPDRLPPELRGITQRQIALKDVYTPPSTPDALPQESDIGGMNLSPATVNRTGPRTINGHYRPRIAIRPGETQLWRIANLGTNMFLKFAVHGVTFHVIAEDGNPVWKVWTAPHLVLPPGKRFEALVQGPPSGTQPLQTLRIRQGDVPAPNTLLDVPPQKVGQLVSSGAPERRAKLPSQLLPPGSSPSDPLDEATIAARRRFVFDIPFIEGRACKTSTNCPGNPKGSAGSRVLFTINGKTFDPNRNDVTPRLGTVEEWTLVNKSTSVHPFHIHQDDFQVMSVNGKPYDARSLQDIVTIPIDGRVVVRIPFRDYAGRFVFHCHILDHQDGGMMATVNVVK
jgi:FtsP/CotA-like multicopper oxidase with cupredoxin domain